VVTREIAQAEGIPGGFTALHDVFVGLEESGRIRRGYFVGGVGAMQFALPHVLDVLRSLREAPEHPEVVHLAATDPANPYGALLKWPGLPELRNTRGPTRSVGTRIILVNGALAAHFGRGGRGLLVWLPEDEPDRTTVARSVAERLAALGNSEPMLITEINGQDAREHPLAEHLRAAGFTASSHGLYLSRRTRPSAEPWRTPRTEPEDVLEPTGEEAQTDA
jgi:ATP-dependent Lhr-like helicase